MDGTPIWLYLYIDVLEGMEGMEGMEPIGSILLKSQCRISRNHLPSH